MFKIGTISLSISGVEERQVVFGAGKMSCCRLHKNAAHFSQLWMRRVKGGKEGKVIFGPKCKFIRCCTIDVGPEGTQIHAVYDTHLTDRKLRGFSKARKRTDVMAVLFFFFKFGIHATWKFNLRNRLARNLPEWWFFVCLLLLLPAALSYWFPFIELSYFTVQTAFTVANAEFLIWSTFFLNCFYSLFALIRIAG